LERQRRAEDQSEQEEEQEEQVSDEEIEEIISSGRRKRARRNSEEPEYVPVDEAVDFCAKCQCRFTVTVYARQTEDGRLLCRACGLEENPKQEKSRVAKKQRKRVAAALLDKKDINKVASLQDWCISTVVKYIDDVDALGDVGLLNMEKISRIVCRNRRLTSTTLKLFLAPALQKLTFWDCSELKSDALDLIPAYCPNIDTLTLGMCGQLTNENLGYFASNLGNLRRIYLDGPFLINKETWMSFLEIVGPRLLEFHVKNTHRIDAEILANMVENCPILTHLTLSRLSGVEDDAVIHLLADLPKLQHLELSYLGNDSSRPDEPVVTDSSVITILNSVGSQLKSLVLDGCTGLTDQTLVEGIRPCCGSLRNLSLVLLDQLTDEGVEGLFTDWTINSGITSISLKRCIGVADAGVSAVLNHSKDTLVQVDFNSVLATQESLKLLNGCLNLTTLDLGFVRATNDELIESLDKTCPHLSLIEVYGDPKVTASCRVSAGRRLIGRQTDTI
jgi:DNA repair protein RAD7